MHEQSHKEINTESQHTPSIGSLADGEESRLTLGKKKQNTNKRHDCGNRKGKIQENECSSPGKYPNNTEMGSKESPLNSPSSETPGYQRYLVVHSEARTRKTEKEKEINADKEKTPNAPASQIIVCLIAHPSQQFQLSYDV